MKSFLEWDVHGPYEYNSLNEAEKDVVVTAFGRFNPPTIGHRKLMDKMKEIGKKNNAEVRLYASHSNDPKKNPLEYKEKIQFLQKLAPSGVSVIKSDVNNPFNLVEELAKDGFKKIIVIAGDDRAKAYEATRKYALKNGAEELEVVSAGKRDPDAEGAEGMSASKMRKAAAEGDKESFLKGTGLSKRDGENLYMAVRKGMGVEEG